MHRLFFYDWGVGGFWLGNNCLTVVSKKHIKCITYEELLGGKEVSVKSQNYLGKRKKFGLDSKVIIDFCNFAVKFFDGV